MVYSESHSDKTRVLTWDEYQKLLDEIGKLVGGDEEEEKALEPPSDTARIVMGIPLTATDSTPEVKILPKRFSRQTV